MKIAAVPLTALLVLASCADQPEPAPVVVEEPLPMTTPTPPPIPQDTQGVVGVTPPTAGGQVPEPPAVQEPADTAPELRN